MKASVALRLGRVSNLPTVWTNVLAASALVGASASSAVLATLCVAFSVTYVGGMYLNDAFDREYDALVRPERPIPSGQAQARSVFVAGFAMLAGGVALVLLAAHQSAQGSWRAGGSALVLAATIVFYDLHHKQNPLGPVVMGACRVLVYATVAFCFTPAPSRVLWIGASMLLAYLIGLSYAAKQENLGRIERAWPLLFLALPFSLVLLLGDFLSLALLMLWVGCTLHALSFLFRKQGRDIPRAVSLFIAGIALLDGLLAACAGQSTLALLCVAGFVATLVGQRFVSGT